MALTPEQQTTLKTAILADPALAPLTSGPTTDLVALQIALNVDKAPNVKAWVESVSPETTDEACNWSQFDSIVAGKRDSWSFFLSRPRNFTRAKVRLWVTDVWGNSTAGSNSEAILLAALENASVAESIIGGPTRTTGTVSGIARSFIGDLSLQDVRDALGL
jgi:hypothetical protein